MTDTRRTLLPEDAPTPRLVNPPLQRGSTVLFESYAELARANAGQHSGITYGTDRLPTQRAFEAALCAMEGGALTRAFHSGIAAIIGAFLAFTKAGDHVLLCDNVYRPGARFCRDVLSRFGVDPGARPSPTGACRPYRRARADFGRDPDR